MSSVESHSPSSASGTAPNTNVYPKTNTPVGSEKASDIDDTASSETLRDPNDSEDTGHKRDHDAMTADDEEAEADGNPERKKQKPEENGVRDEEKDREDREEKQMPEENGEEKEKKQAPEVNGEEKDKKEKIPNGNDQGVNGAKENGTGRPQTAEGTTVTKAKKAKKAPTPRSSDGISSRTRSRVKV